MSAADAPKPQPALVNEESLSALLEYAQANGRVCPMPGPWQALYEWLPAKRRKGLGWEPALPLVLVAWDDSPAVLKALRLREHIEWAESHGALTGIDSLLRTLSEDQWHHRGDA